MRAPDFARAVDIHRKPGFDPVELVPGPEDSPHKTANPWRLLRKNLGFRMLMDVIPLDAGLVRGSHGRCPADTREWPVLLSARRDLLSKPVVDASEVFGILQRHVLA